MDDLTANQTDCEQCKQHKLDKIELRGLIAEKERAVAALTKSNRQLQLHIESESGRRNSELGAAGAAQPAHLQQLALLREELLRREQ